MPRYGDFFICLFFIFLIVYNCKNLAARIENRCRCLRPRVTASLTVQGEKCVQGIFTRVQNNYLLITIINVSSAYVEDQSEP